MKWDDERGSKSSPRKGSSMKAATMEELTRGKKQAFWMLSLLKDLLSSPENQLAAELLVDVIGCFTRALSYLELEREETTDQPPRPVPDADFRPCSDERRSDLGRRERKLHTPRKINCQTRTILSTTIEDGHIWRKYGQKEIYGTKHSRSYYRCIHKHDRGCPVTRQVQRTEENDSIFAITYVGQHTCMEDGHTTAATNLQALALESKMNKNDDASDDDDKELAAPPSAMKRDCEEEMISIESTTAGSCSSSEISSTFSGLAPLSAEDGNSSANFGFGMGIDELIVWMSAH